MRHNGISPDGFSGEGQATDSICSLFLGYNSREVGCHGESAGLTLGL